MAVTHIEWFLDPIDVGAKTEKVYEQGCRQCFAGLGWIGAVSSCIAAAATIGRLAK
jgi:hypothetical protein